MNFLSKFKILAISTLFLFMSTQAFSGEFFVLNLTNRPIQYAYSDKKFIEERWKFLSRNASRSDVITVMPGKFVGSEPSLSKGAITIGDLEKQMNAGKEVAATLCTLGASCAFGATGVGGLVAACPFAGVAAKLLADQGLAIAEKEILAALTQGEREALKITGAERSEFLALADKTLELEDEGGTSVVGKTRAALAEKIADATVADLAPEKTTLFSQVKNFCKKFTKIPGVRKIFDFNEDQKPIIYIVTMNPQDGSLIVSETRYHAPQEDEGTLLEDAPVKEIRKDEDEDEDEDEGDTGDGDTDGGDPESDIGEID